jgi:hypothetical protein
MVSMPGQPGLEDLPRLSEGQGMADGMLEPQAIEHVAGQFVIGFAGGDEEVEYVPLNRESAAEDVAFDIADSPPVWRSSSVSG